MRKVTIALLALGLVVATTAFASNVVRISQVYGGGGSSSGYYKYDYVELFNNSGCPVNIGGWTLQYGSATGSFASNTFGIATIPAGATIPACGYYLIQCGSAGSGGIDLPITADFANAVGPNLSGSSGKVAIFSDAVTNRTCAQALAVAIDLVGYGTANCYEGAAAAPVEDVTHLEQRGNAGATDTDQNGNDFTLQLCSADPPHNTASARSHYCEGGPVGACCLPPLPDGCIMVSQAQCIGYGGVYIGDWIPCSPDPCPTPVKGTTWGQVKTLYR
jgi:hypothetical protein